MGIRQYPPVNRTGSRVVGYGYFSFPNIRRNPYYLCLYEDRSKSERATATSDENKVRATRARSQSNSASSDEKLLYDLNVIFIR